MIAWLYINGKNKFEQVDEFVYLGEILKMGHGWIKSKICK